MKNLVVTVIIAIVVMASFSQTNAQSVIPVDDPGKIISIDAGDIIEIGEIGVGIDEERKIYVQVEDGNNTDSNGNGTKVHFKVISNDGQNMGSYNFKYGQSAEINIPEGASIQVKKAAEGATIALF